MSDEVLDQQACSEVWCWQPRVARSKTLEEIADVADEHPQWMGMTA